MALAIDSTSTSDSTMMPHFLFQLLKDHNVDRSQILIVNDNPKSKLGVASVSRSSSSSSSNFTSHAPLNDGSDSSDPEIITVQRWGSEPVAEYDSDSVLQLARQKSSLSSSEPFKVKRTDKWMGDSKPNSDSSLSMPKRKSSLESTSIEATSQQALQKGAAMARDTAPQRPPRKGRRPSKANSINSQASASSSNASSQASAATALGANAYLSQHKVTRKQGRRRASLNNSTHEQKKAWAAAISKSPPRPTERKRAPRRSSMDNAFLTTDKAMEMNMNLSNHSKSPTPPNGRKQRRASMDTAYTVRQSSTTSMDVSTHSMPPRPPSKSPPRPVNGRKQARRASMDNTAYYSMRTSMDGSMHTVPPSAPRTTTRKQARRASMDTALSKAIEISTSSSSFTDEQQKPKSSGGRKKKQARRASMDTAFHSMKQATSNTFSTLYSAPTNLATNLIHRHRHNRDMKFQKSATTPEAPSNITPPTPRLKKKTKTNGGSLKTASSGSRNSSEKYQQASKSMPFAFS